MTAHVQNDLISPAFPDMITFFKTTPRILYLSSTTFSLGVGIGGLFFGPLSDFIGRKKALMTGFILISNSCLLEACSNSIYYIILLRFLQGIGTAGPMVVCVAIIFDHYDSKKAGQIVGYKNGVLTFGKSIASVIGGYLNTTFDWRINFIVIMCMSLLCLAMVFFFVKESNNKTSEKLEKINIIEQIRIIFKNFVFLLSDKLMIGYLISLGSMSCILLTYTICSSVIFITYLGVEKSTYGYYQASVWISFGVVSVLSGSITNYFGLAYSKFIGFTTAILGVISLNIAAYLVIDPLLITVSMILCSGGFGLIINILFTRAMSLHPNLRGASSSMIAFTRTVLLAINVGLSGIFSNGTIVPLTIIITVLAFISILIYVFVIESTNMVHSR